MLTIVHNYYRLVLVQCQSRKGKRENQKEEKGKERGEREREREIERDIEAREEIQEEEEDNVIKVDQYPSRDFQFNYQVVKIN